MNGYDTFINKKTHEGVDHGFDATYIPDYLFPFQKALVDWSVKKGRGANFADCGLGKTPMSLVWAQNIIEHTNDRILILTPLAVGAQYAREAKKFDIDAKRSDGELSSQILITNYEKITHFNPSDFVGVICDESSILKNYNGARRSQITSFMRKTKYRLLATATAAPNDFIELGTSSEALGYMGHMDMLNKFFKNNQNNSATGMIRGNVVKWRLKGHAELAFWRWVCSWARSVKFPSDLGFDDDGFVLPPLTERVHVVDVKTTADGMLFNLPACGLKEQREERRRSIVERCEKLAELVETGEPASVWCHLNDEGDLLEKLIPGSVQVAGKDSDEAKEEKLLAFQDGEARVLITKPKIGAWGLNFQHCNHVLSFPSHSFEQYYQSVRRCWRFGQKREVNVDVVTTEGEQDVLKNLQKKQMKANEMFTRLVGEMNNAISIKKTNDHTNKMEVPLWL